ncbi:FUSC family protein [Paenibacillus sp. Marseille-Q4541]|uniref:FUSC family protein n=1 Tax=Paenibacillus sp. Marseille-Q4541 TaxID=2831522 RepID=UPI001BA69072|nr:FUSC family protein [Paenibacillus sp. Marseille-Q4541]
MDSNAKSIPKTRTYIAQHLKRAFRINKAPIPWGPAVIAGLSSGIPLLCGIAFHEPGLGLLATTGAFVNVYMRDETARHRFLKLTCILLGLVISVMLGTLAGSSLIASAVVLSLIGAAATFLCGVTGVLLPAGYMFVLVCGMATALPADPGSFAERGFVVLLGGIPALVLCMLPIAVHPYGPEKRMLAMVYGKLADMLESLNTDDYPLLRLETGEMIQHTKKKIYANFWNQRKQTSSLIQLYYITKATDQLFWAIVSSENKLLAAPSAYPNILRKIANRLPDRSSPLTESITQIKETPSEEDKLPPDLRKAIHYVIEVIERPPVKLDVSIHSLEAEIQTRWSLKDLYKYTTIFSASMKMGILVLAAYTIAFMIGAPHPSWVPIGCASVLIATTATAGFYRGIQLMLGTCLGGLLASILLFLEPTGLIVALVVALLQFTIKTLVAKNYALAAIFITPISLLLVALAHPVHSPLAFVNARIIDILLGCSIGLMGMLVLSPHSASRRLNQTFAAALSAQAKLLEEFAKRVSLLSTSQIQNDQLENNEKELYILSNIVLMSLKRTSTLYDKAFNEITHRPYHIEEDFPLLIRIQKVGYLAILTVRSHPQAENNKELHEYSRLLLQMSDDLRTGNTFSQKKETSEDSSIPSFNGQETYVPLYATIKDLHNEIMSAKPTMTL